MEQPMSTKPKITEQMTCTRLPTDEGSFQLCLYQTDQDDKDHLALVMGEVEGKEDVLVRVHSECFTGDVLGSLRCDCGPQLARAMELIAGEGVGIVLYLRQEGRGIGLLDKLRAYNLQDMGYDTVDANLLLGHQADARDYTVAAQILQDLGVRSVRLLTNNPAKIESLEALGMTVTDRAPLVTRVTSENASYLATKVERMRHLLDVDMLPLAQGTTENGRYPLSDRPFITLSYAQSINGAITEQRGRPMAISGPESLTMTHKLRAGHDAILVGIGTVLADDPRLDVRRVQGEDPQPVILDSQLRFPLDSYLLHQNSQSPWIFTTDAADPDRRQALEEKGARIWEVPGRHGRIDLSIALNCLLRHDIHSLIVEGGAEVITSFLEAHLVDQVVVTIAPMLVGGLNAVDSPQGGMLLPRLQDLRYRQLGNDLVLSGKVAWDRGQTPPETAAAGQQL
jgi:3,4-dihydroxy 2-butanone 4-phosphate synthase/GTP cyclohydrolase II